MTKIGFWNNKGGVGKTTCATNFAYILADSGQKVLAVDCDTQSNLVNFFNSEYDGSEVVLGTRYKNISVAQMNAQAFENIDEIGKNYDYVIVDLPPTLNDEVKSIISHCDFAFIPLELGKYSIDGVTTAVNFIHSTAAKLGGVFITKYFKENKTHSQLLEILRESLGSDLLTAIMPFSMTIQNSPNHDLTAFEYMKWNSTVVALGDLFSEILERSKING
jgi:chromosome partitioning protein